MLMQYICTKQYQGIFDTVMTEKDLLITYTAKIVSLEDMIIKSTTSFTHLNYFVVDLACVKDHDEELISAFEAFASMYNARIIVLAYNQKQSLLKQLIDIGIYNIIVNNLDLDNEINKVLSAGGKEYKEALSILDSVENNTEKVIKIGVIGTMPRIGTTTQASCITRFLKDKGQKACYVEKDGSSHIYSLVNYYNLSNVKDVNFIYEDITIFHKADDNLYESNFDFFVLDFGNSKDANADEFLECDIKIVVTSTKPWEIQSIAQMLKIQQKYDNIIFSFNTEKDKGEASSTVKDYFNNIYFSEYSPSLFDNKNSNIYADIFKGNLHGVKEIGENKTKKKKVKRGLFKK